MNDRTVVRERIVAADASTIFAILTDPQLHPVIDGSGMLKGRLLGADRLELGARFGMRMNLMGLPYAIMNTVVEFEPDRRIAWRHLFRHRWRYELLPETDGRTLVRETFDYGVALPGYRRVLELIDVPQAHERNIERTLVNLERLAVEHQAERDGDIAG